MLGQIVKIEDDAYNGKDFKKVTLGDGSVLKVKQGREGSLKAKWGELVEGKTYEWTMGSYNDKPFVKDFKVTTEPPPPVVVGKPDGMTPELWAEKDRAYNHSIETQVAFKGIIELAKACVEKESNISVMVKFPPVYDAALDWAMAHFTDKPAPAQKPVSAPTKSTTATSKPVTDGMVFADAGKLKTAMQDDLGMNGAQISAATAPFNLLTEQGRKDCWSSILAVRSKPDEENATQKEVPYTETKQ